MNVTCEFIAHSHRLVEGAFEFINSNGTGISVEVPSERSLVLTIDGDCLAERFGSNDQLFHCHVLASAFLMALNVAALGYFGWKHRPTFDPIYRINQGRKAQHLALSSPPEIQFDQLREFTDLELERTVIIFGAMVQDDDEVTRHDYLKGLLHVGASHMGVKFNREAFFNFYRCTEAFVTRKILRVRNLGANELREIQRALQQIGAGDELSEAFREIYALRGSMVAHAQRAQVDIELEDVIKAKTFADLVMHTTYRQQADAWRRR